SLNEGALWGMGQGFAPVFALLSVIALVGIVYWLFFKGAAQSAWLTTALGLVTGGTLGNLYDRLALHGVAFPNRTEPAQAVRDFLHFIIGSFDWPIFNLADSFLVIGAMMMMAQSFRQPAEALEGVSDPSAPSSSAVTQK
ncbi:MAG: signal peptidase II, partial [Planctomyces sp.]|nr:signal peptidase II [Planctomyces sp.]